MPGLRDPAIGLSCDETPFYPPKTMALADMPVCESCSLVFSAPVTGTKMFSSRAGLDGITVDESPLAELIYNTTKYALFDTIIWKKGAHRNFKASDTYDLEMNLYFRDVFDPFKQIAVAIPITIDDSKSNPYFTEMANQNGSVRLSSLEKIISEGSVVMYKGIDLRNRNSDKPYVATQCQSATSSLTWFILQTTYISANDAKRIRSTAVASNLLPPVPQHEATMERARNMSSSIATIQLKSTIDKQKVSEKTNQDKGIYLTRALQCQRINPLTDVKNDAVYLHGESTGTLDDELNASAADSSLTVPISSKNGIRPKQIETWLAAIVGIIFGIIIFIFLSHFIVQIIFSGYIPNMFKNEAIMPLVVDAKATACAPFAPLIASASTK